MGETSAQAKARALREFDQALSKMELPRFSTRSSVSVGIDVPSLEGLRHDVDRELLNRANIQFGRHRDISLKISRTSDGVSLKFIKKFG